MKKEGERKRKTFLGNFRVTYFVCKCGHTASRLELYIMEVKV